MRTKTFVLAAAAAFAAIAALMMAGEFARTLGGEQGAGTAHVNGQPVSEGDVVARGTPLPDGGCDLPELEFGAETTGPRASVSLRIDEDCVVTVDKIDLPEPGPGSASATTEMYTAVASAAVTGKRHERPKGLLAYFIRHTPDVAAVSTVPHSVIDGRTVQVRANRMACSTLGSYWTVYQCESEVRTGSRGITVEPKLNLDHQAPEVSFRGGPVIQLDGSRWSYSCKTPPSWAVRQDCNGKRLTGWR